MSAQLKPRDSSQFETDRQSHTRGDKTVDERLRVVGGELLKTLQRPRMIDAVWSKVVHSKDINQQK